MMMTNSQILLPLLMNQLTVLASIPFMVEPDMLKYNKGLIANGVRYNPLEYPYVVTFTYAKNKTNLILCTGTLLTKLFILTAAHCTHNRTQDKMKVKKFWHVFVLCISY